MELSACGIPAGDVSAVTEGAITAHVRLEPPGGAATVASVTNEAAEELVPEPGDRTQDLIKASDVLVGKD